MDGTYLTQTDYVGTFHREMTPAWLGAVLAALGQEPPAPARGLRYCDLGCGPGLGTVLAAAANPSVHFTAIDANPGHVAQARALAAGGGIANIDIVQADFAALATAPADHFEPFDIIALHGVFSWVDAGTRRAVLSLIDRFLAPCGIVYLHYMAHPGLASFAAGQMVLRRFAEAVPGDAPARAQAGLGFLQRLADAGAGYFVAHPEERQRLENARGLDARYLAHEFLNPTWQPLHVAEVMEMLADIGCAYLGSADPSENIDALSVPGDVVPLLNEITDPALRETVKDFARNQSYRRDIYRRGAVPLDAGAHMRLLENAMLTRLPGAPRQGGLTFNTRIGPVEGAAELFSPLLRRLAADGRARFADFSRQPPLSYAPALLNQAFQMLSWCGSAHPAVAGAIDAAPALRLNRYLARHTLARTEAQAWLAAPRIGSAIAVDRPELAAFLAATVQKPGPAAAAGAAHLPRDADAAAWQARFTAEILPSWQALGMC